MSDDRSHIDFEALTAKYLSGEATADEIRLLEDWVKADEGNRRQFVAFRRAWRISRPQEPVNTDAAWKKLQSRMPVTGKVVGMRPPWSKLMRIAAVVALFIAVGFALYQMFADKTTVLMAYDSVATETLPDGSRVTLNRNSSLSYPEKFSDDQRKITLDGDAFFEVVEDPQRPFLVDAGNLRVQVLGTSFYVNSGGTDRTAEVAVSTGKVSVASESAGEMVLLPGEKAVLDPQGSTLKKLNVSDHNFLAWKTKKLVFEHDNLSAVAQQIEQAYGVQIEFAGEETGSCKLTATFEDLPLEDVFGIIAETLNVQITKKDDIFVIRGEGCK